MSPRLLSFNVKPTLFSFFFFATVTPTSAALFEGSKQEALITLWIYSADVKIHRDSHSSGDDKGQTTLDIKHVFVRCHEIRQNNFNEIFNQVSISIKLINDTSMWSLQRRFVILPFSSFFFFFFRKTLRFFLSVVWPKGPDFKATLSLPRVCVKFIHVYTGVITQLEPQRNTRQFLYSFIFLFIC